MVLIRQEAKFLEQITGCESPKRYYAFSQSPQAGMKLLFKCKEYGECCMRNCCPANNREFNMAIKHLATANDMNENFSSPFVDVRKPCKCTWFCLERRAGRNIGLGIFLSNIHDDNDIAVAVLLAELQDKNINIKISALFGLWLAAAGIQNEKILNSILEVF